MAVQYFSSLAPFDQRGYTSPFNNTGTTANSAKISLLNSELSKMNAPTGGYLANINLPELPRLQRVSYDPYRERAIQQQIAAPLLSQVDMDFSSALNRAGYEPSAVKANTIRQALAGRGQALSSIMSGAGSQARGQYNFERGQEINQNMADYNAALGRNQLLSDIAIKDALQKEQQRQSLLEMIRSYELTPPKGSIVTGSPSRAQASLLNTMDKLYTQGMNWLKTPSYSSTAYNPTTPNSAASSQIQPDYAYIDADNAVLKLLGIKGGA